MDLRNQYKSAMSARDYRYFDTYSRQDQVNVIDEAKDRLQEENLRRMKECIKSVPITKLLGLVSHVGISEQGCSFLRFRLKTLNSL
jgi:hypothetical protein